MNKIKQEDGEGEGGARRWRFLKYGASLQLSYASVRDRHEKYKSCTPTNQASLMLDSTEILRSGSMLAIAVVLIVVLQKIASYFRRESVELNEITDSHYWTDLDTLLKVIIHDKSSE